MTTRAAILVDPDPSQRQAVARVLAGSGVAVAAELDAIDQLSPLLGRADAPRIVLVNLDPEPRERLRKLGALVRTFPVVAFLATSSNPAAELVMDAMDVGVRAFVPLPLDRGRLVAAMDRLIEQAGGGGRRARVIQFVPTIGGCGATTIACAVAASLAGTGKTLVADLDLVRGAVANGFDVRPRHSIADVAGAAQLDRAKLESMLAVHRESGLGVLARPGAAEDAQRVTGEGIERLMDVAGAAFDFVVLDTAMSFDGPHAAATRAADVNVLVVQLTVPSAKNAERYLQTLRRMGIDPAGATRLVLNRFTPERSDIQPVEIERALGLKVAWTLPNDFATAMGAINFGEPVTRRSPRTELSRSLVGLAQLLAGRADAPEVVDAADARHQVRSPT